MGRSWLTGGHILLSNQGWWIETNPRGSFVGTWEKAVKKFAKWLYSAKPPSQRSNTQNTTQKASEVKVKAMLCDSNVPTIDIASRKGKHTNKCRWSIYKKSLDRKKELDILKTLGGWCPWHVHTNTVKIRDAQLYIALYEISICIYFHCLPFQNMETHAYNISYKKVQNTLNTCSFCYEITA